MFYKQRSSSLGLVDSIKYQQARKRIKHAFAGNLKRNIQRPKVITWCQDLGNVFTEYFQASSRWSNKKDGVIAYSIAKELFPQDFHKPGIPGFLCFLQCIT